MRNCYLYTVALAVTLGAQGICIWAAANNPLAGWIRPGLVALGCQMLFMIVALQGYRLGDFRKRG